MNVGRGEQRGAKTDSGSGVTVDCIQYSSHKLASDNIFRWRIVLSGMILEGGGSWNEREEACVTSVEVGESVEGGGGRIVGGGIRLAVELSVPFRRWVSARSGVS